MNDPIRTQVFRSGSKELRINSVSLAPDVFGSARDIPDSVAEIFSELAPFAKQQTHQAHIRPFADRGPTDVPGAWVLNDHEFEITPWDPTTDSRMVVDSFAEELHHLIRYQHAGVPQTLGEIITAEAMARVYAEHQSRITVPWIRGTVAQQLFDQVRHGWDEPYDHKTWFVNGPHGPWAGYRVAYRLGKHFFQNGFDLQQSLTVPAIKLKEMLP